MYLVHAYNLTFREFQNKKIVTKENKTKQKQKTCPCLLL